MVLSCELLMISMVDMNIMNIFLVYYWEWRIQIKFNFFKGNQIIPLSHMVFYVSNCMVIEFIYT
jgi:hypothetical protein